MYPKTYIEGSREFCGLDFIVTESTMIPRIETELIVDYVVQNAPKGASLLDLGTGCGNIAISIAKLRPDLKVRAVEKEFDAFEVAKHNDAIHQTKIEIILGNLFENVKGTFDIITANLPYLPNGFRVADEVKYEPKAALFGGLDGLDIYRRMFEQAPDYLNEDGFIVVECLPYQFKELEKISGKTSERITDLIRVF